MYPNEGKDFEFSTRVFLSCRDWRLGFSWNDPEAFVQRGKRGYVLNLLFGRHFNSIKTNKFILIF